MKEMIWEEMRKKTMQFMFCREREQLKRFIELKNYCVSCIKKTISENNKKTILSQKYFCNM